MQPAGNDTNVSNDDFNTVRAYLMGLNAGVEDVMVSGDGAVRILRFNAKMRSNTWSTFHPSASRLAIYLRLKKVADQHAASVPAEQRRPAVVEVQEEEKV